MKGKAYRIRYKRLFTFVLLSKNILKKSLWRIGKERGTSSGVPEQDIFRRRNFVRTDKIEQTSHRPAGVYGIKQDPFRSGKQRNRFPFELPGNTISGTQVILVQVKIRFLECVGCLQPSSDFI